MLVSFLLFSFEKKLTKKSTEEINALLILIVIQSYYPLSRKQEVPKKEIYIDKVHKILAALINHLKINIVSGYNVCYHKLMKILKFKLFYSTLNNNNKVFISLSEGLKRPKINKPENIKVFR